MEEKRSIVHLDLDTFFVSVERLFDDRLKVKPILIGAQAIEGLSPPAATKHESLASILPCPCALLDSSARKRL